MTFAALPQFTSASLTNVSAQPAVVAAVVITVVVLVVVISTLSAGT